jgi:hypothetical protein
VTKSGQKVLEQAREQRNAIWGEIPKVAFES